MTRLCLGLSYLLQCGFFLICPTCRSCSAIFCFCFCFPEGVVPYVAVDSMCPWEEVRSGPSYTAILNWSHSNSEKGMQISEGCGQLQIQCSFLSYLTHTAVPLGKLSHEYTEVSYGPLGMDDFILQAPYFVPFESVLKIPRML